MPSICCATLYKGSYMSCHLI